MPSSFPKSNIYKPHFQELKLVELLFRRQTFAEVTRKECIKYTRDTVLEESDCRAAEVLYSVRMDTDLIWTLKRKADLTQHASLTAFYEAVALITCSVWVF